MKRFFLVSVVSLLLFNLFSVDLTKIKEGDSKTSVIKQYGMPFKEIKNGKFEYDVWFDKKDIWMASFEDEKLISEPIMLDDFLNSLMDLRNAFDDLADSYTTNPNSYATETEQKEKINKTLLNSIDVTITECKIYNKTYDPTAGYKLKVKNNSDKIITKLTIVIYFYDKKGKIFFEDQCPLIDSESFSIPSNLKPNYSVLIPEYSSSYYSVKGMDIDEWDEGKVTFEVIELE
jgi:hypothetical protein